MHNEIILFLLQASPISALHIKGPAGNEEGLSAGFILQLFFGMVIEEKVYIIMNYEL